MGLTFPLLIQGNVAHPHIEIAIPGFPKQPYLILGQSFITGMSGGPVFNWNGEIVSIVQMGDPSDNLGIGRPLDTILRSVGKFWE